MKKAKIAHCGVTPVLASSSITYTLRVCVPRSWHCINFIHFQDTLYNLIDKKFEQKLIIVVEPT
ncbi:MAG: hypothetical protein K2W97_08660 [Chthoniobacterales bacterium]|nr:hypothetical protein [Chthoniobacterales bacterium]